MEVETGEVTNLVAGRVIAPGAAQYSPDGKRLFYSDRERGVVARDLPGGSEAIVVPRAQRPHRFLVAPDGASVAFIGATGSYEEPHRTLYVQRFGGPRRALTGVKYPSWVDLQAWTPDSRYLLYSRSAGSQPYTLWRIPAEGGESVDMQFSILPTVNPLSLSPDGRRMAYVERVLHPELWITPLSPAELSAQP